LALKNNPAADAAIMGTWPPVEQRLGLNPQILRQRLDQLGIFRPVRPIVQHAQYRFLIDIDGVANAWSFFEKLMLGSCLLKVQSPFEQWFYEYIHEWHHFVPVNRDLSDLEEKLDWCLSHESDAREIAIQGQQFALNHSYETGRELALDALRRSMFPSNMENAVGVHSGLG
jgi:hypothetical protein